MIVERPCSSGPLVPDRLCVIRSHSTILDVAQLDGHLAALYTCTLLLLTVLSSSVMVRRHEQTVYSLLSYTLPLCRFVRGQ